MILLQDWITVQLVTGSQAIQNHSRYLDLGDVDDIVTYLEVSAATTTGVTLFYDTSPSADEASFLMMAKVASLAVTSTPLVTPLLAGYTSVPLARFLRWRVLGNVAGTCTFRITVATYAPGA